MCKHQRLHMKYNKSFTSLQYMIVHNGGQVINKPIIFTIPLNFRYGLSSYKLLVSFSKEEKYITFEFEYFPKSF